MFVTVVIQHALRMSRILLLSVACLSVSYFQRLSKNLYDFSRGGVVISHRMCVLIFSLNLPEKLFFLRRIQRDIIVNVYLYSSKVPVILVRS